MKAIRIHANPNGGHNLLQYDSIDKPVAKAGEIVVKNDYAGINFIDIYHRSGLYKLPLPHTLGREGAGTVDSVGEGVTEFQQNDKVCYCAPGSYAEYTSLPAAKAYKLPAGVTTEQGAALMLQGLTAHYLIRSTFPVNSSHTILVHAGAGGLGQLVIQMAKHLGATVITTVSSEQKAEIVRRIGADHVIIYTTQDFLTEVRKITNNQGVHVVYDSVGLDTYKGSLDSLRPLGYLVLCGNASGAVPPIDPLVLSEKGSLFLTRPTLANYIATREALEQRCQELFDWVAKGVLKVSNPTVFNLSDADKAQDHLTSRKSTGKILLNTKEQK